jgi:hypothetical protein
MSKTSKKSRNQKLQAAQRGKRKIIETLPTNKTYGNDSPQLDRPQQGVIISNNFTYVPMIQDLRIVRQYVSAAGKGEKINN